MIKKVFSLLLIVFLIANNLSAQNIFHSREFWATKPSIEVVQQKIAEGHNILEMGPGEKDGPLLAIMADCSYETIKYIFDLPGIDVNKIVYHSNNYIMWAAAKGNLQVMNLLLAKGSRTDIINSKKQSLLMHAALSGKADKELYDFCIKNGGNITSDKEENGKNVLLTAIAYLKDLSILQYFLEKGLSLKDVDSQGNGLFNYAVQSGNLSNLQQLVGMGVKPILNNNGETPFAFVGKGRGGKVTIEMLQYLKSLHIDSKSSDSNGQNLAHTLARLGLEGDFLTFLDQNDIDKTKLDHEGNSPLMLNAARGNPNQIQYWSQHANINAKNKKGQSALHQAIGFNTPEAVKQLISLGAKVNIMDGEGNNLYYTLVKEYKSGKGSIVRFNDIVNVLIQGGLSIQKDGLLLHLALSKNDQALIEKLLAMGEDINAKDKEGYTVLHYAAMRAKDLDMVKFLINKGANPKLKTELDESLEDLIKENESLATKKLTLENINR
jgi:uncharacterized protein